MLLALVCLFYLLNYLSDVKTDSKPHAWVVDPSHRKVGQSVHDSSCDLPEKGGALLLYKHYRFAQARGRIQTPSLGRVQ